MVILKILSGKIVEVQEVKGIVPLWHNRHYPLREKKMFGCHIRS